MALMQRGLNGVYTRLGHRLLDMGRGTALFGDGTCIYSECRLQGNGQMRGIFEGAFLQPQAPAAIALTSEQKILETWALAESIELFEKLQ